MGQPECVTIMRTASEYQEHIGQQVIVTCADGQVIRGTLVSVDDEYESGLGEEGITVDSTGIWVSEIETVEVFDPIVKWIENLDLIGVYEFTFDGKTIFNLFADYPWKLTKEQKEIFDRENPYWAEFFKDRG